ncbi:type II toxin-antitoxin system RelE/ParE family toxin [Spirochaeta isovalerica]|uniref:Plasmid stabilization system protein ParE n=1 Tax=Spirochaeta isovalerica TaxID=150 RepID=A0A841RAH4_9SPIO|nr:type II toxin-antitoxin system RelE/ParE family toxin [Spirochaeta isovalerica]MBB6480726.1 plasmid stabilization system protein ParE [Spirochaeta isovalerica]
MVYNIKLSPIAESDLDSIVSYYHTLNPSTAKRYFREIFIKIRSLKDFPLIGRIVPECMDIYYDKYRELIYENYRIIYRIEADVIYIIRILDARMDMDFTIFGL